MGIGGVIILALMALMAFSRSSQYIEMGEGRMAVGVALTFTVEVAILVVGNPWLWAAWAVLGGIKILRWPSHAIAARIAEMPQWALTANVLASVLMSGCTFALFQWLR